MNDEETIRDEATDFFEQELEPSANMRAIDDFHLIRRRLADFYTAENKAIFLDEIESQIRSAVKAFKNRTGSGYLVDESKAEKLLFYIRQEKETLPTIIRKKSLTRTKFKRTQVFVSYSHADTDFLEDMKRHFKPFLGEISFLDDSRIEAGQKWKQEIAQAISKTKVAILLVSADFLGSEFISSNELPPLLSAAEKEGATILIVILKPCLFEEFPALNQFLAMNPPSKPVTRMDLNEREELFVNLVRQTKKVLDR